MAATNVNLTEALEQGTFRKDLFYRLSVVQIEVPPLRERDEDAVYLAQTFLSRYRDQLNARVTAGPTLARPGPNRYNGCSRSLSRLRARTIILRS